MNELRTALEASADDTEVDIRSFDSNGLSLAVNVASRGNEKWLLRVKEVIHLDMSPSFTLGQVEFGRMDLLADSYVRLRNFNYGGDINKYRVIKFTDIDGKNHIVVFYGEEDFVKVSV
jgi:hypothetical protein